MPARASATSGRACALAASSSATLMATNRTSGSCQAVQLAVGKSDRRVPIAMTTSASLATAFAAEAPVAPSAPRLSGWSQASAPLPACVSTTGMPNRSAKSTSAGSAAENSTPPPHTIIGRCGARDGVRGTRQQGRVRPLPRHDPDALLEQVRREVERLRLDVLGQRQRHGAGLGGRGEHPERARQRGQQLLRAVDAVPVATDGPEGVVDAHVLRLRALQLLEHRASRGGSRTGRRAAAARAGG